MGEPRVRNPLENVGIWGWESERPPSTEDPTGLAHKSCKTWSWAFRGSNASIKRRRVPTKRIMETQHLVMRFGCSARYWERLWTKMGPLGIVRAGL